ncbi:hypothetical protein M3B43_04055 [Nesterenkonia massiliensis]|uniref:Uncharacterized protein n=1 Tax=Nesterenkonia massiliensis TaxID=1232429 RepID=A0ABT2HPB8_9MICC|nr:hypothetical protein [Nesterenkonia massiliensis]MCT1606513.1 hypothetical protein [Nesterenkonia massiliensis]
MVDEIELRHRFDQEQIPILTRRLGTSDIVIRVSVVEAAHTDELEPIGELGDDDAPVLPIVLVSDSVVQLLQTTALVVFRDLPVDQLIGWQQTDLDISDAALGLRGGNEERRLKCS